MLRSSCDAETAEQRIPVTNAVLGETAFSSLQGQRVANPCRVTWRVGRVNHAHVTLDSLSAKLAKRLFERSLPGRYSLDLGRQFVLGERYEENLIYACERSIDRSSSLLTVEEQPESMHFNAVLNFLTSE
jgi:hypothetical protein